MEARGEPRDGVLVTAIAALVVALYAPALAGGFVWDDHALIERHPAVAELASAGTYFGQMFWANPEFDQSPAFYRPLTVLSYALQQRLFGAEPLFFHAANVLIHALSCVLLFFVCRRAGASSRTAALAAFLFGAFPRLSESVAWISGRTDLLASLAVLAAWLLYRPEPERAVRRAAAGAALLLGLFAKEVALAGVVALGATESWRVWRGRTPALRAARNLAPLFLATLAYALARGFAWQASGSSMRAQSGLPFEQRPAAALQALGHYVRMLADPLRPQALIGALGETEPALVALGALAATALVASLVGLARRAQNPHAVAAAALATAAILPVLHLLPIAGEVVAADRYLYLPCVGLAVLLALGVERLPTRWRPRAAAAGLVLALLFGATTTRRAAVWADELRLWQAVVQEAPVGLAMAHAGLGEALLRRGRYEESLAAFREAARRSQARGLPDAEYVSGNMALCLAELGRHAEAIELLEGVVAAHPEVALHHFNLALVRAQRLDFAGSEAGLNAALALYPGYPRALGLQRALQPGRAEWQALGPEEPGEATAVRAARARVYARLGNHHAAGAHWDAVLAADDASPGELHGAAIFLVLRGDPDAALRAIARLRHEPGLARQTRELEAALAARRESS